jgi:DNA-binding NarL/FixJ family response regulator
LISAVRRLDQKVPIIAASGLNSNGSVAKASAAGVRHFLAKPYNTESLLKVISTVLSGKPMADSEPSRRIPNNPG